MKIRYVGSDDPSEHGKTTAFGATFVQGEWVDVPEGAESLATNPMFEADDAPRARRGRKADAEVLPPE